MPIEFSVAAFRLGHSMIREAYNWNAEFDDGAGHPGLLVRLLRAGSGDLGGGARLATHWVADFRRLYDFGEADKPGLVVPADKFNRAMRIDTRLANALGADPQFPVRRRQPGVPQPDPGEDGHARHRSADGRAS